MYSKCTYLLVASSLIDSNGITYRDHEKSIILLFASVCCVCVLIVYINTMRCIYLLLPSRNGRPTALQQTLTATRNRIEDDLCKRTRTVHNVYYRDIVHNTDHVNP